MNGILAYFMQRGNAAKRNVRGLLSDPVGVLGQWGEQTAEDMTTPQQRAVLAGQQPFQVQDPALQRKMLDLALQALTVYHGSPHKFAPEPGKPLGSFRSDKIGTGEGAQAYGYGHYVAESPKTAAFYKQAGSGQTPGYDMMIMNSKGQEVVGKTKNEIAAINALKESFEEAALYPYKAAKERVLGNPDVLKIIDNLEKDGVEFVNRPGILYKADLADDAIPKMLDWDKPLSQQPENIKNLIRKGFSDEKLDYLTNYGVPTNHPRNVWNRATGSDLYEGIGREKNRFNADGTRVPLDERKKYATEVLKSLGIPGIRYLDANSRGLAMAGDVIGAREQSLMTKIIDAQNAGNKTLATKLTKELENLKPLAKPTHNYVVFPGNEGLLKILERQ